MRRGGGMLEAVLFDMDGVLVESIEAWRALLDDAVGHFGARPVAPDEFASAFGQSVEADVDRFLPGVSPAELERFYTSRFPSRASHVRVMEGAHALLARLRRRGLALACVTNAPRAVAVAILGSSGLLPGLDALVGVDEVASGKPAPDMLHEAGRRIGRDPARAAMVGDSRFDVEAARAAGALAVVLGERARGDLAIRALPELEDVLGPFLPPNTAGAPRS